MTSTTWPTTATALSATTTLLSLKSMLRQQKVFNELEFALSRFSEQKTSLERVFVFPTKGLYFLEASLAKNQLSDENELACFHIQKVIGGSLDLKQLNRPSFSCD